MLLDQNSAYWILRIGFPICNFQRTLFFRWVFTTVCKVILVTKRDVTYSASERKYRHWYDRFSPNEPQTLITQKSTLSITRRKNITFESCSD